MKTIAIIANENPIDSNLVLLFLNADFYVKIAVTNIAKTPLFAHVMDLDLNQNLHVSEIDLYKEFEMANFTKDCDYVLFCQISRTSV
ncbi:MAG: hypothetical protein WA775_13905 [Psychroserpens sp.]|uniref:hypothetical protein n=1 Tax=Psychroserpens sp. TaxID=2020870 RepID=UPI003C720499